MNIYLLTPMDRSAADWQFSMHAEPIQVEALDEKAARSRASLFLGKAAVIVPGRDMGSNPWRQLHLVAAIEVEDADPAFRLIRATDDPENY